MYRIKVSSITNAQKADRLLRRRGLKSHIGRIENPQRGDGCGYYIKTEYPSIREMCDYLTENGVRIVGVEET